MILWLYIINLDKADKLLFDVSKIYKKGENCMIYRNHNSNKFNFTIESADCISATNPSIILNEYKLMIPKAYAREETSKRPSDVEKVPHYELYIERQIGSVKNRRGAFVYWKLPKSGTMVAIKLYPDGGADFQKEYHKIILRETDELDRRIVLGFCILYHSALYDECFSDKDPSHWIKSYASLYTASKMPKRLRKGASKDMSEFYKDLAPYDENTYNIFNRVQFI